MVQSRISSSAIACNVSEHVVTSDSCSAELCCSASEHAEHLTLGFTELSGQTHLVSVGRQQPFSASLLKLMLDIFPARCFSRNGRVKAGGGSPCPL